MVPLTIRYAVVILTAASSLFLLACGGSSESPVDQGEGISPGSVTPTSVARPPASLPQTTGNAEFSITVSRQIRYTWPAAGAITTYFGEGHPNGIDIALELDSDSPIKAAAAGTVVTAGGDPCCSLGVAVEVEHADGSLTRYGHLGSVSVQPGQAVRQGDIIGMGGSTGESSGKHLHFELYVGGVAVDPLRFLPSGQQSVSGTERLSCGEASLRLDPASEIGLRLVPRSVAGYSVKTVAYTGITAAARNLGITAEGSGSNSLTIRVPEMPSAAGTTIEAGLDIVLAKDGAEDQLLDCLLTMTTRRTLPNPPGTGLHIFDTVTPVPTATPTRTPVLGAQPVKTQAPAPPPRITSTPVRNPTPVRPVVQ